MPNKGKKGKAKMVNSSLIVVSKKNKSHNAVTPGDGGKRYRACLMNPFSNESHGAQIPDMFPFPTSTRRVGYEFITSSSSGGTLNHMITPHPLLGLVNWGASSVSTPQSAYGANGNWWPHVSASGLNSVFSSWRVVGFGIRIKNLQAPLNMTGRLIVGVVPGCTTPYLDANVLSNITFDAQNATTGLAGVTLTTSNGNIGVQMLNFPMVTEVAASDLFKRDVQVNYHPLTQDAFNFHTTNMIGGNQASGGTTTYVGPTAFFTTASGAIAQSGYQPINVSGMPIIFVYGTGFPNSTIVFSTEVVLHLEGTTNNITGGTVSLVADSPTAVYSPNILGKILSDMFKSPFIRRVASTTADAVLNSKAGFGSLAMRGGSILFGNDDYDEL